MRIDEAIYQISQSSAELVALVGTRVHPLRKPMTTQYPALNYHISKGNDGMTLAGPDGLRHLFVDIASMGTSYTNAQIVADAVRAKFHGFSGQLLPAAEPSLILDFINQSYVIDVAKVQGCWLMNEQDLYHDDPKRFTILQEYEIYFCE